GGRSKRCRDPRSCRPDATQEPRRRNRRWGRGSRVSRRAVVPASRRLELGKPVRSSDDEVVGELCDVIIDPIERRVTHLVVKPHEGHGQSRLVEVAQANPDAGDDQHFISLRCTADEVHELPNIEDVAYLRLSDSPVSDPNWDVGVRDVLALPYYESSGM